LSDAENDAVRKWLARLDEAQPSDGHFSTDILASAGAFPVYKPPGDAFDNRHDEEKASQHFKWTTARAFAAEMADHYGRMSYANSDDATREDEDRRRTKVRYWSEIATWIRGLSDSSH
jgi:hypothetical protein